VIQDGLRCPDKKRRELLNRSVLQSMERAWEEVELRRGGLLKSGEALLRGGPLWNPMKCIVQFASMINSKDTLIPA